jgi:ubiquinone/menaquinone biosynthesis C-methylase UbiE
MNDRDREQQSLEDWNGELGDRWVRNQARLDAWLEPLGAAIVERIAPRVGERVLDVGCGCGASSLELARRVGPTGRVLGVDLSRVMLARAAARARAAGLAVELHQGDVAVEEFGAGGWDVVHSRFGVMFFEVPASGFGRLRRAIRTGGRLGFVCWQRRELNDWVLVPSRAVDRALGPAPPAPAGPGPFQLADRGVIEATLHAAGFRDPVIEAFRAEQPAGTVDAAVELFGTEVGPVARRLAQVPAPARERALRALRDELAARAGADGVVRFEIAAWLVTASA